VSLLAIPVMLLIAGALVWGANYLAKRNASDTAAREAAVLAAPRCVVCEVAERMHGMPRPDYSRRDTAQMGIGVMPPRATVRQHGEPALCSDCSAMCVRMLEQHLAEEYAKLSTLHAELAAVSARFEGGGMVGAARRQYRALEGATVPAPVKRGRKSRA